MVPPSRGLPVSLRLIRHYAILSRPGPLKIVPKKRITTPRRFKPAVDESQKTPQDQQGQEEQEQTSWSTRGERKRFEQGQEHEYSQEQEQEPRRPLFNISESWRRWIYRIFMYGPPAIWLFLGFVCPVEPMRIIGTSMYPFFNVNSSPETPEKPEWLLVRRSFSNSMLRPMFLPQPPKWQLERGQIVIFHSPSNPSILAVKRVVGIPGDRVKPLPGYPGGDEPVVVPYNHIWVEGDANDREKSVDSNWYGPISQNLVTGCAKVLMTPWHSWTVIRTDQYDYPAKKSGRIEHDVVHEAKVDPDTKRHSEAFSDGTAERELTNIRKNREFLPTLMRDEKKFLGLREIYLRSLRELENENPESQTVAHGLIDELEAAFEAVGLAKDGTRLPVQEIKAVSATPQRVKDYLKKHQSKEGT